MGRVTPPWKIKGISLDLTKKELTVSQIATKYSVAQNTVLKYAPKRY